jgi:hypothetical protein
MNSSINTIIISRSGVAWLWLNLLFFTCSTLPLAALFFNAENTDKDVRSLLLGDVQFR